jgi:superfamily I DNA/RNA helicase
LKHDYILQTLSPGGIPTDDEYGKTAKLWWKYNLFDGDESRLTFDMMTRLIELLVTVHPGFRNSLRSTYRFAFLDEFQDTNRPQYDFVKTTFRESSTVITAVGDEKQYIMSFAGALEDAFGEFDQDFKANKHSLEMNFRSSPDLVAIQRVLVQDMDPNAVHTVSQGTNDISEDACEIIRCATVEEEACLVADEIESRQGEGITGDRFAVIVRQKSSSFLPALKREFDSRGMKIRDDGEVQNLLSEDITDILLTFLRLGATKKPGKAWSESLKILCDLRRVYTQERSEIKGVERELEAFRRTLHDKMKLRLPSDTLESKELVLEIADFLGVDSLRASSPKYQQERDLARWVKKFVEHLASVCESNSEWIEALDEFEGIDTTPVMTLYKSKGLEYYTVFFVGLENGTWWTLKREPEETRKQFFVAFSRAEQRVVVTSCENRDQTDEVDELYNLLRSAGVKERVL